MNVLTIQGKDKMYQQFSTSIFQKNGLKEILEIERQSKLRCLRTSPITIVDTNRPAYIIMVEEVRS